MPVLIQLTKIEIGYDDTHKTELTGVDNIVWGDSDPWIPMEYPTALTVTDFQHVKPVLIEGILECFDVDSFITVFYETDIQVAAGNQFAIYESGQRKRIEFFHVTGKDHDGEYVSFGEKNIISTVSLNFKEKNPYIEIEEGDIVHIQAWGSLSKSKFIVENRDYLSLIPKVTTGSFSDATEFVKVALSYKANDFKMYFNGSLVGTDTSGCPNAAINPLKPCVQSL